MKQNNRRSTSATNATGGKNKRSSRAKSKSNHDDGKKDYTSTTMVPSQSWRTMAWLSSGNRSSPSGSIQDHHGALRGRRVLESSSGTHDGESDLFPNDIATLAVVATLAIILVIGSEVARWWWSRMEQKRIDYQTDLGSLKSDKDQVDIEANGKKIRAGELAATIEDKIKLLARNRDTESEAKKSADSAERMSKENEVHNKAELARLTAILEEEIEITASKARDLDTLRHKNKGIEDCLREKADSQTLLADAAEERATVLRDDIKAAMKPRLPEDNEGRVRSDGYTGGVNWEVSQKSEGTLKAEFCHKRRKGAVDQQEKDKILQVTMDLNDGEFHEHKGKLLGRGACGAVYQTSLQDGTGEVFALKLLDTNLEFGELSATREMVIFNWLDSHPNILKAFAMDDADQTKPMLLEMADGDLFTALDRQLPLPYRIKVTKDIAAGLAHMHRKGVAHCDVKPENVLLFSGDFTAKLSDFGISLAIGEDRIGGGTLGFFAPETEVLGPCRASQDYYSMGILLLTMLCKDSYREDVMVCHSDTMTEEENKRLTALSKLDADGNTVPEREEFLRMVMKRNLLNGTFENDIVQAKNLDDSIPGPIKGELLSLIKSLISVNPRDRPNMTHVGEFLERLGQECGTP